MEMRMEIEKHLPIAQRCFEFVKACFGALIIPNMAAGVEIDGEVLLKLAGQGAVYIRELFPEDDDDFEDERDDDELLNISISKGSIKTSTPKTPGYPESSTISKAPSSTDDGTSSTITNISEPFSSSKSFRGSQPVIIRTNYIINKN
eukprot:Seg8990.1 transcript_id=Seg8990.1/GoldUCD/mRNA.D3Y31 product="hypothetical protein" protein_id=Seg8990.1/GoldUCD/D3Y31